MSKKDNKSPVNHDLKLHGREHMQAKHKSFGPDQSHTHNDDKSPLNFGGQSMASLFSGRYGNMSDEDLRSQYDTYSSMSPMMGNMGIIGQQRNAMQAEIERRQSLGNFGMPQGNAEMTGSVAGAIGPSGSDPNNSTGNSTYATNPNANMGGAVGAQANAAMGGAMGNELGLANAPSPQEGNFNPTTEQAAANIFGNSQQFKPRRKLINL